MGDDGKPHPGPRFIHLYTTAMSPFCVVLDAWLRAENIPHVRIEVDPWRKSVLRRALSSSPAPLPVMPYADIRDGETVSKTQEIVEAGQKALGGGTTGLFTAAQKNQCMRINERVLPLVALNRHLTLESSRETTRYMTAEHKQQWGVWHYLMSRHLVPVLYWRIWRKMAHRVLKDTGYANAEPLEALVRELEAWHGDKSEGELFSKTTTPDMVDLWMFGNIAVFRNETLFGKVEQKCPKTMAWMKNVEKHL